MEVATPPTDPLTAKASGPRPVRAISELPGPRGVPLLGNTLQLETSRFHSILNASADRFGPMYRYRIASRTHWWLRTLTWSTKCCATAQMAFGAASECGRSSSSWGWTAYLTPRAQTWAPAQAGNARAEHQSSARILHPTGTGDRSVAAALGAAAAAGETVDAPSDLRRFTVDVTSSLAFGKDLNTLEKEGDLIQRHLDKIFPAVARRLFAPFPYWRWFKLPVDRELDAAVVEVHKLVNDLVADARQRTHHTGSKRPGNFLDAMVAGQTDGAAAFTDAEIVGNALTMLLAGEDTTSNTLAWMMHLMIEYPPFKLGCRQRPIVYWVAPSAPVTTPSATRFSTSRRWRKKRCGSAGRAVSVDRTPRGCCDRRCARAEGHPS